MSWHYNGGEVHQQKIVKAQTVLKQTNHLDRPLDNANSAIFPQFSKGIGAKITSQNSESGDVVPKVVTKNWET